MVRFIHTADWQLGMTRRYLSAEAQARFDAARLDVVRTIGRLASERDAAFVLVAGDVFESNHLDRRVIVRALEAMGECPVPIYLLPGNHDPLDAASVYTSEVFTRARPDHVVVLSSCTPLEVAPDVELVAAPWPSKRPLSDLLADACADLAPPEGLRIAVAHGAVDERAPDPDDPALIGVAAAERAIEQGVLHYVALGDRHSLTAVGRAGRIHYSGAPEPTDFDEVDPGKVLLVDLHEDPREGARAAEGGSAPVMVEPIEVGTWRFVRRDLDLAEGGDVDELERWLDDQPGKDRTVLRIALVGTLTLRDAARLDAALERAGDAYAAVERWEAASDLAVLPDDADVAELDLAGFARTTADELATLADGAGEEARTARDALALLYRLSAPERAS